MLENIKAKGTYHIECIRHYCPCCDEVVNPVRVEGLEFPLGWKCVCGWEGPNPVSRKIWDDTIQNTVMTAGMNHMLDTEFHASAQSATWYVGLIRDDNYSSISANDTLASHAGWEEGDEYSGNRKEFVEAAASGGAITNSANKAAFSINATETMKGGMLCNAESGTSGTLFSAGLFSEGDRAVVNGDTINVAITITLS